MYAANVIVKLTLLFTCVSGTLPECICTKNAGQATCTDNNLQTLQPGASEELALRMDSSGNLLANAIPFNNMQSLNVHCNVESLHFDSLTNQASLTELDFSRNSITKIPNDFFSTTALETLHLSHNKLDRLTMDTFYALKNLKILDVSHNQITNIELGVLDEMKKLEKLYLNNNQIATLVRGVFDELSNLLVVDMSHNQIRSIEPHFFEATGKLEHVNLAGNYLNGKEALNGLAGFKMLTSLSLSDCQIHDLPLEVFAATTKLQKLDLSKNSVRRLPPGIFDHVKDLTSLNLASCNLTGFAESMFNQNRKLEELDLSFNQLNKLPEGLFNVAKELKYLNLSHNLIGELPLSLFQYAPLVEIDISYNDLTTIEPDFLNMETLERVHLQNNKITHLHDETFASCTFPVKYLNLQSNRLVFLGEYFFDWLANLERMEIFGNPWQCKCLEELLELLNNRFIDYDSSNYYQGKIPICVSGDGNACNYDDTNLTHYYELYKKTIDLYEVQQGKR